MSSGTRFGFQSGNLSDGAAANWGALRCLKNTKKHGLLPERILIRVMQMNQPSHKIAMAIKD
jgi:hypothetical protein